MLKSWKSRTHAHIYLANINGRLRPPRNKNYPVQKQFLAWNLSMQQAWHHNGNIDVIEIQVTFT